MAKFFARFSVPITLLVLFVPLALGWFLFPSFPKSSIVDVFNLARDENWSTLDCEPRPLRKIDKLKLLLDTYERNLTNDPQRTPPLDLSDADLSNVDLSGRDLRGVNLFRASLTEATLDHANLNRADLRCADFTLASVRGTRMSTQNLMRANFARADLTGARLLFSNLEGASFAKATLMEADLTGAVLGRVGLQGADLRKARFENVDLDLADYRPSNAPAAGFLANMQNLTRVAPREPDLSGLSQLRSALAKVGLRNLEREATYAIESWRTFYLKANAESPDIVRAYPLAWGRWLLFDLTTSYGLHPSRALILLVFEIYVFGVVYFILMLIGRKSGSFSGLYRIEPKERVVCSAEILGGRPIFKLADESRVSRLEPAWYPAVSLALWISVLSAFRLGYRYVQVGSWIATLSPHEFEYRPIGMARVFAGIQSILSLYLLVIWIITLFGRPFV